ncbi:MAG: DinB family protein [Methylococcales bacterium]
MEQFQIQKKYNKWMNEHFYMLCDKISDEERKRDAGAFFKSIHGTLNHILLGDRLWMSRFQNTVFNIKSLDQELYSDYDELKKQRVITDSEISNYIDGLTEEQLGRSITFVSKVKQAEHTYILRDCILHLFQHQIHHRGQVSTLISQLGIDIGITDMMWMPGIEITGLASI